MDFLFCGYFAKGTLNHRKMNNFLQNCHFLKSGIPKKTISCFTELLILNFNLLSLQVQ